jgi:hypothetical protein
MFGSTVLSVVLGLIFVYFVFSMACSRINESVSARLQWRARDLEKWLHKALDPKDGDLSRFSAITCEAFTSSSLITAVTPEKKRLPCYIPPQTFSLAVLDMLAPGDGQVSTLEEVKDALSRLPSGHPAKAPLTRIAIEAGDDLAAFRAGVERWFNDSMGRVSGWYKRRVGRWMLVYAAALTVVLNVDTLAISRTLWNQDTVRQAVVAQAGKESAALDTISADVSHVKNLSLPVGWKFDGTAADGTTDPRAWPGADPGALLVKLIGLAITTGALSLGAPFWFDLLNKVARLRSTGVRPDTSTPPATVVTVEPARPAVPVPSPRVLQPAGAASNGTNGSHGA